MAKKKGGSNFFTFFVVAVALAVLYSRHTLHAILFAATDALWGNWPLVSLANCPRADVKSFAQRAKVAETVDVSSIDDCLKLGEARDEPLVCRMKNVEEVAPKVIEAIKKDNTQLDLICRDGGDVHWTRPAYHTKGTIEAVLKERGECAAGFIYGDFHQSLLSDAFPVLNKTFSPENVGKMKQDERVMFGTSFVSNFLDDRISTGTHAAMVTSLAFQLEGTKVWILHSHEQSSSHYYYRTSWRMFPNCLAEWLTGMKNPYVATTHPGEILFFPLAYQHLVYTSAGRNVMTNIRKVSRPSKLDMLAYFSPSTMAKIIADRVLVGKATGNPRDSAGEVGIMGYLNQVLASTPESEKQGTQELKAWLQTFM